MSSQVPRQHSNQSEPTGEVDLEESHHQSRARTFWAYMIALPGIGLAVLIRWQLSAILGERGLYSTLLPTVMIAAYLGGFWPGIAATVVGAIATNYFIVNHLLEVELKSAGDSVAMVLFLITGAVVSLLSESLHRAHRRIIQDERRRAARSIEQTEKRFSHLVENSSDIMTLFSADGTVLYQTPSVTRVLGYLPDERIGRNAFLEPIVHPEDLSVKKSFFQDMIDHPKSPVIAEFRLKHRSGHWRYIEAIGQNLLAEPGISGLIVNYRDVTDRKRADQTIRDSEERWRSLVQLLPQLIWTTDGSGQSDYFSPQVSQYTGLTDDQLFAGEWLDSVHQDDYSAVVEHWNAAVAGQTNYDLEHRIRRRDGEFGWFKVRAVPVWCHEGRVSRWIGSCTEITEIKELESELRHLNRRFELAVRGSNIAIWEVDLEKGRLNFEHGKFINVWEQLGFHSAESRQPWASPMHLVHDEDRQRLELALDSFLSSGAEEFEAEPRFRHYNGHDRWLLIRGITLIDEVSRVRRFTGTSIDVSNLKETEQALRDAKEAAESANRSKDEFLANVSHEIRTPMNAILGMTELVLESSLTESQRRLLQIVKSAGDNLLSILNDLLDFSKIEAGKLHLDSTAFSLRQSIGDVVRLLATRAHAQGLEFVCDVADDVPDSVVGDAGRLRQILLNLIGNAIKFTPSGEVVVNVARCSEPTVTDDVRLQFSVRDTGIGIPAGKQQSIFRAFEQEDTSTTRKYGGTGLGLTITSYLVQQMGGTITVESKPGQGSLFRFEACFKSSNESIDSPNQPLPTLEGRRVLVVDDNETNRIILENWLKRWKLDPCCVANGKAALENLTHAASTNQPFELVVLDRRMPDFDGVEVVRHIRNSTAIAALPVILLTSGDPEEDEVESKLVKVQARLTKPCQQPDLLHAIQNALTHVDPAESQKEHPLSPEAAPSGTLNILVAEDNQFNALLLEQLLKRHGHSVTITPNGKLALEAALQQEFDVLLLDIHMPELDGFQVARAIREQEQQTEKRLPILALTARSTPQVREQCLAAGMDDLISKPMKPAHLWKALNHIVDAGSVVENSLSSRRNPVDLIDTEMILSVCGGSQEMLTDLIESFLQSCPFQMQQIHQALSEGDLTAVRESAHRLAGTLRAFSRVAGEEAISLEEAAESSDLELSRRRVHKLDNDLRELSLQVASLTIENLQKQL